MSYVVYDRSIYRTGFRPLRETDTFAASNQLGTGAALFHPARLHGMGQQPPFTRAGGYGLHGLGALGDVVPDGSVVTYRGKWNPGKTSGGRSAIDAVTSALSQDGLKVTNVSWDSTVYGSIVGKAFDVTLQIFVQTGMGGFGNPSDVASIVDHEVWTVTGQMPLASSVPMVQAPGGAPSGTGQPAGPGADPSITSQPPAEDWSSWIQDNFAWVAIGAAAVFVLPSILGRR